MDLRHQLKQLVTTRSFWILVIMLAGITFLHYSTPQMRLLSPELDLFLSRHAMERIIFLLPVVGASFAFGQIGGLITLIAAILAMLPRSLWISPTPSDAILETAATGVVGYLVVWIIETQAREKRLREKAVEELATVNAVARTVSQSLDLGEILEKALGKLLDGQAVIGLEPRGAIFLLGRDSPALQLMVHRGLPSHLEREWTNGSDGEYPPGLPPASDRVFFSAFPPQLAEPTPWSELEPYVVVPLRARNRVLGAMLLSLQPGYAPADEDRHVLAAIGSQIGLAIDNARLYENMRFYAQTIIRAQENERKRIAQELHDETIQMLIATSRRLEALTAPASRLSAPAARNLEQARELTLSSIKGVRRFIQDLRPPTLDHLGLLPALETLTSDLGEENGVEARLTVAGKTRRLSPEEEMALFRIVQEALNNIRRHSRASRVSVHVVFQPEATRITVEDDGQGFETPDQLSELVATGRLGLVGMYERAQTVNGVLAIHSEPGKGTIVSIEVPLPAPPAGET